MIVMVKTLSKAVARAFLYGSMLKYCIFCVDLMCPDIEKCLVRGYCDILGAFSDWSQDIALCR